MKATNTPEAVAPMSRRLRRFGQRALGFALLGIFPLWVSEFFSEPAAPKGWKLLLLLPLMLLGGAGAGALLLAALVEWSEQRKQ